MTNPLAGGPEDAPRKPDDPQPSPHGRDLTQLPMSERSSFRPDGRSVDHAVRRAG